MAHTHYSLLYTLNLSREAATIVNIKTPNFSKYFGGKHGKYCRETRIILFSFSSVVQCVVKWWLNYGVEMKKKIEYTSSRHNMFPIKKQTLRGAN